MAPTVRDWEVITGAIARHRGVIQKEIPFPGGKGVFAVFPNAWGVSVSRHYGSYGGQKGFFEIGFTDASGKFVSIPEFDFPSSDPVRGWLDADEVADYIDRRAKLANP